MKRVVPAALAAAALVLFAITTVAAARPVDAPARHGDVEIKDDFFDPASLTVQPGKTVVWAHEGANPHTVSADDGSFQSGTMFNGQTFQHTFTSVGTFSYFCQVHGGMAGVIEVVAPTGPQPTTIDSLGAAVSGTTIAVTGSATFNGELPVRVSEDPEGDGPLAPQQASSTGVDLTGFFAYQPDPAVPKLVFEWDVTGLPDTGSLPEAIRYTAPFRIGTTQWQLQAKLTNVASVTLIDDPAGHAREPGHFQLRGNCTASWPQPPSNVGNCPHIAWLEGEFDVTEDVVRIELPIGASFMPQLIPGAELRRNSSTNSTLVNISASYQAVASNATTSDEAPWGEDETFVYRVPSRTVRLGIVPEGGPAQFTVNGTVAANGSEFGGSLSTAGLAPGSYDVWVQACFGTNCATEKVTITI